MADTSSPTWSITQTLFIVVMGVCGAWFATTVLTATKPIRNTDKHLHQNTRPRIDSNQRGLVERLPAKTFGSVSEQHIQQKTARATTLSLSAEDLVQLLVRGENSIIIHEVSALAYIDDLEENELAIALLALLERPSHYEVAKKITIALSQRAQDANLVALSAFAAYRLGMSPLSKHLVDTLLHSRKQKKAVSPEMLRGLEHLRALSTSV